MNWEEFERQAYDYMCWLVVQDESYLTQDDYINLMYLEEVLSEYGFSLDAARDFRHVGGSDSTVSDIEIGNTGLWIEVKMRAAQCGQMVVERDKNGLFRIASSEVNEIAPWVMPDASDDPEMDTETPDSFFSLEDGYLADAREDFLNQLNYEYEMSNLTEDEGEEETVTWNQHNFMVDDPASAYLVYNHYENKGAVLFLTRRKRQPLDNSNVGWLLFPTYCLDQYFHVSGSYRYKKSGSSKLAAKNIEDAANAFQQDADLVAAVVKADIQTMADGNLHTYFDIADASEGDILQSIIEMPCGPCLYLGDYEWNERKTFDGAYYRYKLLYKGDGIYQIRQLSKVSAPTIVMKERVRDNNELQR